jgi:hypothetical protein
MELAKILAESLPDAALGAALRFADFLLLPVLGFIIFF